MPPRLRASGCLFGVAIGDALAASVEFMSFDEIVRRFGRRGPERPGARVTDDTQMTLAVGEALLKAERPYSPATLEAPMRRAFVEWFESPENDRAPGVACMQSCTLLADGRDWIEATTLNSKGCGTNMRVAPVGLLPATGDGAISLRKRCEIAQFQAALTHGHPTALAAADLTAAAIADLVAGGDAAGLTARLRDHAEGQRSIYHAEALDDLWRRPAFSSPREFIERGWDECLAALDRLDAALADFDESADPCTLTGDGWIAEEAFATAMLCYLAHPNDAVAAVRHAAVSGGDSDSIAAITGSLAGAALGLDAWPVEWAASIEYRPRIERLGREWDTD